MALIFLHFLWKAITVNETIFTYIYNEYRYNEKMFGERFIFFVIIAKNMKMRISYKLK